MILFPRLHKRIKKLEQNVSSLDNVLANHLGILIDRAKRDLLIRALILDVLQNSEFEIDPVHKTAKIKYRKDF